MRYSKQREAVYDVLCHTNQHPDAATIYNLVRQRLPNISLGTVYRNLDELCALGKVRRVGVEGGAERFDAQMMHHAHFVCTQCGSVLDVPADEISLQCQAGSVARTEVTMYGVCNNCQSAH